MDLYIKSTGAVLRGRVDPNIFGEVTTTAQEAVPEAVVLFVTPVRHEVTVIPSQSEDGFGDTYRWG